MVRAAELIPPTTSSSPDDRLDLETLLIIAGVLAALPRQVVHEGLGGEQPFERHRAVLGYVVQRMLPHFAGGAILSSSFVHKVIDRLLALDQRTDGKFLDGLPQAIERGLHDACLELKQEKLVSLYGPLFRMLIAALETAGAPLVLPVFTTNYDETFDFLGEDLHQELSAEVGREVVLLDGTEPSPTYPGWRTFVAKRYSRIRPPAGGRVAVVVFYLHGSIRWFGSPEARPWFEIDSGDRRAARQMPGRRVLLPPNAQKVAMEKSSTARLDVMLPERKDPFRPGAPYYAMRLAYLFFERCLQSALALLTIGYSFRDSDGRDALTAAWKQYGRPRLVLLDPRPEPIVARLGPEPLVIQLKGHFEPAAASEIGAALEALFG